jgi:hypothetical protein
MGPGLGVRRSLACTDFGALESGFSENLRDFDRAAEIACIDPRLCGLLDDAADQDR